MINHLIGYHLLGQVQPPEVFFFLGWRIYNSIRLRCFRFTPILDTHTFDCYPLAILSDFCLRNYHFMGANMLSLNEMSGSRVPALIRRGMFGAMLDPQLNMQFHGEWFHNETANARVLMNNMGPWGFNEHNFFDPPSLWLENWCLRFLSLWGPPTYPLVI